MAIKQTLDEFERSNALRQQIEMSSSYKSNIEVYRNKHDRLATIVGQWKGGSTGTSTLELVSTNCDSLGLLLKEFPPVYENEIGDNFIETQKVVIQGTFIKLVRFIELIERSGQVGKVASVKFQKIKNKRTRKYYLIAEIYLQVIKQNLKTNEIE